MRRDKQALELFKEWVGKIGRHEATKRLVIRDVPTSTADKLVRGAYPGNPRPLLITVILEEMAKDGLSLSQEAS